MLFLGMLLSQTSSAAVFLRVQQRNASLKWIRGVRCLPVETSRERVRHKLCVGLMIGHGLQFLIDFFSALEAPPRHLRRVTFRWIGLWTRIANVPESNPQKRFPFVGRHRLTNLGRVSLVLARVWKPGSASPSISCRSTWDPSYRLPRHRTPVAEALILVSIEAWSSVWHKFATDLRI